MTCYTFPLADFLNALRCAIVENDTDYIAHLLNDFAFDDYTAYPKLRQPRTERLV
jgi:hypothetical protein